VVWGSLFLLLGAEPLAFTSQAARTGGVGMKCFFETALCDSHQSPKSTQCKSLKYSTSFPVQEIQELPNHTCLPSNAGTETTLRRQNAAGSPSLVR
jgi:hypothetical protein